ncbi:MAG: ABC transporter ATP-binding protein [Bacilli bacterium]|nr:ABC transporter ATP-binding protein [Bacilli bacterium]
MKPKKEIIIEAVNLSKNYGSARGINNINLQVFDGEMFGFIGPNGAGKSTFIRTMLNFLFPTAGEIKIFGMDAVTDSSIIKENIGYVPSEVNYYDYMRVIDLLNFAASFHQNVDLGRIDYLCKKFNLDKTRKISELSFGNKKKVSIVQALLHKPKLLILDEPTNGLDPLMQKELFNTLKEAKKEGTTVFLSSHNLSEVERHCDRVGIIKEGIIVDIKDVSKINHNTIKKVVITTSKKINLKVKGISNSYYAKHELHFRFSGNINELLMELSKYDIKDISIFPLTLEDDFLEYYGK